MKRGHGLAIEVQSEEFEAYGRVSFVNGQELDPDRAVLFLGGWNQDPDRMDNVLRTLAVEYQRPSVGYSPFDVNLGTPEAEPDAALRKRFLELHSIPEGMLRRATLLTKMNVGILPYLLEARPRKVLGHCAGPNVYLAALCLERLSNDGFLPTAGVLAEPMLAEDETTRSYGSAAAKHKRAIRDAEPGDKSRIGLDELSPEVSLYPENKDKVDALSDIANSRGLSLYIEALASGAVLPMILGEGDYAASAVGIPAALEGMGGVETSVHRYDERHVRVGHGYLLAEPSDALRDIAPILDTV